MYAPVTIIYIYILDLDLEQVARQDKRYRARTSPRPKLGVQVGQN